MSPATRRPRWPWFALSAMLLAVGGAVVLWNLTVPYTTFSPGPVRSVAGMVEVEGIPTYPPDGEMLLLTVAGQKINPFEAAVAGLDPAVDVLPEAATRRPGESDEELLRRNRELADLSKQTAIGVALRHLGYEVEMESDGVRVLEVQEGVPAASVLEADDLITAVEGEAVYFPTEVGTALEGKTAGETVALTVSRGGSELDLEVELAAHPDDPGRAMIGIVGEAAAPRFGALPFGLELNTGQIGGPSAGLMYTLAIIDVLTEGDLTGGHVVAGTGTIDPDGRVGGIGGARQKVVSAEAAGADYVLVPASNLEEALTAPVDNIVIVPVSTLEEALTFLATLEPV